MNATTSTTPAPTLAELAVLSAKATPGPYEAVNRGGYGSYQEGTVIGGEHAEADLDGASLVHPPGAVDTIRGDVYFDDAEFMAAACNHVRDQLAAAAAGGFTHAEAAEIIEGLVAMIKAIAVMGNLEFNFNCRPILEVISEVIAADTSAELRALLFHKAEARA